MRMTDSGDNDDKIIAVPANDPRWDEVKNLEDVNKHTLKEIEHFFSTYKKIQEKEVSVTGFEDAQAAKETVIRSRTLYKEKYRS